MTLETLRSVSNQKMTDESLGSALYSSSNLPITLAFKLSKSTVVSQIHLKNGAKFKWSTSLDHLTVFSVQETHCSACQDMEK
jgi:hypothetical protein